ncbi:P27 family phage terminase small subunit [Heyndrickxia coagulans]|uniref:P27 family phage terminase small subunit n=1 Tax=Heyndrickxia coagulans TaxID=1398 RepID=UPI0014516E34|nr:P27 family phage terminase small subunit [Heyndrickxia coagulans]MED4492820.1 P27 family phage terminase small subunit [Heyndrickxia coagulans]MED4534999.1 P27 family phage terminase small subunit [Heyndrickxia coagulans]QJE31812.1 hypothetical protein HHU11_03600 [Heyndrickxia coagulans]
MAKLKRENLRKRIEHDLIAQLKENQIVGNQYFDLVQDYLALWDVKCQLIDDIETNGVRIVGKYGPKSNPSISELNKTNGQMLKILSDLGLKPVPTEVDSGDDV